MTFLYILIGIFVLIGLVFLLKLKQMYSGRAMALREIEQTRVAALPSMGSVSRFSILPLVDYHTHNPELKTEPGVSYLVKADDAKILLDVGFNMKKEHPSPLLHNMNKLGISPRDLDAIFISHLHLDHMGGMREQKQRTFSLSQGPVELRAIPVYASERVQPSSHNPGPVPERLDAPKVLRPGVAGIGVIPRQLFLMGRTLENALAVNVAGKGIVLVIGCGHQTIERILDRAVALFKEPIYGVIGGLHFPVHGGRIMAGPLNLQNIVGADRPPWNGIGENDVRSAIAAIQKVNPQIVALSPHDSSDWSIERFREAFGARYRDIRVGEEILI